MIKIIRLHHKTKSTGTISMFFFFTSIKSHIKDLLFMGITDGLKDPTR